MAEEELKVPKRVETDLDKLMRDQANEKCKDVIADFAKCIQGRTVTVVWYCRAQNKAMIDCHRPYVNEARLNELKREWLQNNPGHMQ